MSHLAYVYIASCLQLQEHVSFGLESALTVTMMHFTALYLILVLVLPIHTVPVTQSTTASAHTDTVVYDAVVLGTNNIVELMPEPTGTGTSLPIPVSTLTNVDILPCIAGEICIGTVFTDSAGKVETSVVAEYAALPASISAAIEGIIGAIDAGIGEGRTASTATATQSSVTTMPASISAAIEGIIGDIGAGVSARSTFTDSSHTGPFSSASKGQGTKSGTASLTHTGTSSSASKGQGTKSGTSSLSFASSMSAPLPTGPVTYAVQVTNSQGSVTDEVIEVQYQSGIPRTSILFAYADSVTTTETTLPTGVSIQTITISTCTTAGAIITTTSSGSTVATEVPELCTHGLAFLIFGLPGFHTSLDLPSLCHKSFTFPLGILWSVLCPSGELPTISIISVDPTKLPPGGGENPNDGNPKDRSPDDETPTDNPTQTDKASQTSQTESSTRSTITSSAVSLASQQIVLLNTDANSATASQVNQFLSSMIGGTNLTPFISENFPSDSLWVISGVDNVKLSSIQEQSGVSTVLPNVAIPQTAEDTMSGPTITIADDGAATSDPVFTASAGSGDLLRRHRMEDAEAPIITNVPGHNHTELSRQYLQKRDGVITRQKRPSATQLQVLSEPSDIADYRMLGDGNGPGYYDYVYVSNHRPHCETLSPFESVLAYFLPRMRMPAMEHWSMKLTEVWTPVIQNFGELK